MSCAASSVRCYILLTMARGSYMPLNNNALCWCVCGSYFIISLLLSISKKIDSGRKIAIYLVDVNKHLVYKIYVYTHIHMYTEREIRFIILNNITICNFMDKRAYIVKHLNICTKYDSL